MNQTRTFLAVFCAVLSLNVSAASMVCPDLSVAAQVNACPMEEELKFTYNGFCSDSAKAYAKETDSCLRYEDYKAMKNVALWESKDGEFSGYVSCDLPVSQVKTLKSTSMKVEKQGKLTKVICSYPQGVTFTHRTKATCSVDNAKATCD
jgi:hypothetical protein